MPPRGRRAGGPPKPGEPRVIDDVAIVLATLEPPPRRLGVTHWSSWLLAAELGVSKVKVADVWRGVGAAKDSPACTDDRGAAPAWG